jgi:hypothetical protein
MAKEIVSPAATYCASGMQDFAVRVEVALI